MLFRNSYIKLPYKYKSSCKYRQYLQELLLESIGTVPVDSLIFLMGIFTRGKNNA
jgi:hypothetical protein